MEESTWILGKDMEALVASLMTGIRAIRVPLFPNLHSLRLTLEVWGGSLKIFWDLVQRVPASPADPGTPLSKLKTVKLESLGVQK